MRRKKGESEGGGDVSETIVEKREDVEDEDGADGEKDREAETKRKREFGKRGAEEFSYKGDEVEEKITAEEEKDADKGGGD